MFKSIQAENLFSWEKLDYEIKPGISQVTGWNYDDNSSEGSGKSSCFNILCWTLYGKIPKDAKIDEVVREGCKNGWGRIHLSDGSSIFRSRGPNDLYITTVAGKVIKGKDAKETQLLINKLIGLDFDAFCVTIYFAQDYPKKFISSNEAEKAATLSQVQDLEMFDKARKKAHDLQKVEEAEKLKIEQDLLRHEMEIKGLKSNAKLLEDLITRFENDKKAELEGLEDKKKLLQTTIVHNLEALKDKDTTTLTTEIEQIEEMLAELGTKRIEYSRQLGKADTAEAEKKNTDINLAKLDAKIEREVEKLKNFKSIEPGSCPTCGQSASAKVLEIHRKHTEEQKTALEKEIEELVDDHAQLLKKADLLKSLPEATDIRALSLETNNEERELLQVKQTIRQTLQKTNVYEAELKSANNALKEVEISLGAVKKRTCESDVERLKKVNLQIGSLEMDCFLLDQKKVQRINKINNLDILKTGFREVKQYVFQTLLSELSNKSTSLAAELFEVPIRISFSNEDEEGGVAKIITTVTLDGVDRSLGLLSGGQYSRVSLAVDLALAGIVGGRSEKPITLKILDEPMKNLSESSMLKVVELIKGLKGSVVIIEHNSMAKAIIQNEFRVEYKDGVSYAA